MGPPGKEYDNFWVVNNELAIHSLRYESNRAREKYRFVSNE